MCFRSLGSYVLGRSDHHGQRLDWSRLFRRTFGRLLHFDSIRLQMSLNADMLWCFDAKADAIAPNLEDCDFNIVRDDQLFVSLSADD